MSHVFATFSDEIDSVGSSRSFEIELSDAAVGVSGTTTLLGFRVRPGPGSTIDPSLIEIQNAAGNAVSLEFGQADADGRRISVAIAKLTKREKYSVIVGSERGTKGTFLLDAILAGDVDGNRRVDSTDSALLNAAYGSASGSPNFLPEADLNYDGRISAFDRSIEVQNLGDRALVNPMVLSVRFDPPPSSYTDNGTPLTNDPLTRVVGTSSAGAEVTLDTDSDGVADYSTHAGADGAFSLAPNYNEGLNRLAIKSVDAFGQYRLLTQLLAVDTLAPAEPQFSLDVDSDSAPIGDDSTTYRSVTLVGKTEPSARIDVAPQGIVAFADLNGDFRIGGVVLSIGPNELKVTATDIAGNVAAFSRVITRTSPADTAEMANAWMTAMLEAIRLAASVPPVAGRAMAMVSTAMYDAVNSVNAASTAFLARVSSPSGASAPAAAVAAAHRVLSYLFPAQRAIFDQQYASSLAQIDPGQSRDDGLAVGAQVGEIVIALREDDGAIDYADYSPSNEPGKWRPTAPGFAVALLPNWGNVKPFAMSSGSQFRPDAPMDLDSARYAADFEEIKAIGRADSSTRTADQTQAARFWSDGAGTYTPAGHWNVIAGQIAQQRNLTLFETLKLMAQLNVAMADASVVAWDAKFTYNQWRPITAIREATTDGNASTSPDASWLPLLVTPPFPDYVSGHSTYSGAAAKILAARFGDDTTFTTDSYALPGAHRTFASFSEAALEASVSRVYGGIHFRSSCEAGLEAGSRLGDYVLARFAETSDVTAPVVTVLSPKGGAAQRTNFLVTGRVVDGLSDLSAIEVRLDDGAPFFVSANSRGEFSATTTLALDGSEDGEHTISVRAADAAGNQSGWVEVRVRLDTAAPLVEVTSPGEGATIESGALLEGTVGGSGSGISQLRYSIDGDAAKPVNFDPVTGRFSQVLDLSRLAPGAHAVELVATDAAGNTAATQRGFVLPQPVPLTVTGISPADQSTDVGVTQRPRVTFSRPIDRSTLAGSDFYISFGAALVPSTVVPADDGLSAWLFPTGSMPAGSVLTVTMVGAGVNAPDGQLLDGDGDGTPGGNLSYTFTTVGTSDVPGTSIFGVLADSGPDLKPFTFDDTGAGPDLVLMTADDVNKLPLANVEIYILGRESKKVYTDSAGRFTLDSVPSGNVKLVANGVTSTNAPPGIYFPEMVMDLTVRPGVANVVMDAMRPTQPATGIPAVHLPRIQRKILTDVSATEETVIGVPEEAAPDLTPEQRQGLSITVQPGSLVGENGQKLETAKVGLSTVPPELVRDMLPPGLLQHTFDLTVQAPGVAAFSTPLEFTAPNVFGAEPGTKLNFLSFDHTTGRLVIEGTGTVSADGKTVTTDPGTGITKPGWHGWTPPGGPGGPPCPPTPSRTVEIPPVPVKEGIQDYYFVKDDGKFTLKFRNDAKMPDGATDPCHPLNHKSTSLVVEIKVDGKADDFLEGLKTQKIDLRPGAKEEVEVDVRDLLDEGNFLVDFFVDADIAKRISSRLFGVKVSVSGTKDGKGPKLFDETFYVYRLLDIADLDHVDSIIDFPKTFADGASGIEQTVPFKFDGPAAAQPTFTSADSQFRVDPAFAAFDPHSVGSRTSLVTIQTPDGKNNGTFSMRGTGVGTQSVHLNQSGMSDALAGLIDHATPDMRFAWLAGIVPDGDGDGLRSDEPGFGSLVTTLYTAMKTNVESSFAMAGAGVPLRLDGAASGGGIAVTWRAESYKARTVNQTVTTDFVGSTIDLKGYTGLVKFDVNVGAVDSLAFLTVRYEHSSDAATWSELGNSWVTTLSSNSKFSAEFTSPKRYVRARVTTLGTGDGAFVIDATGYKGSESDYDPAWAYWADFDRSAFDDLDAGDTPVTGKRFMMSMATNRSANDNGTDAVVANLDVLAQYVASSFDFGTLLGNAVAHEVGHDLGAIHFRSSSAGYIAGDVMGTDGTSSAAVVTFQKLAPIVKFALGVPVSLQETRSIFKYYDAMMSLEDYRFNSAGYRSGGNVRHGNGDEDTRIDGAVLRMLSSPIEAGQNLPTEVTQLDLGSVIADGTGNESKSASVWLFNDGDESLTISGIDLSSLWGVTITGYSGGDVVLQPFHAHDPNWEESSLRLILTFDPNASGELDGRIAVMSDSVLSDVDEFSVSARAVAAGGELRTTTRANLGGVIEGEQSQSTGDELVIANHGSAPVVVTSVVVSESASEFVVLGLPPTFPDSAIVLAPGERLSLGVSAVPSALGLRRGEIMIVSNDPQSPVARARFVVTSWTPEVPNYAYGSDYVSMEPIALVPIPSNRLVSGSQGDWEVFLPPNRPIHYSIFDPVSGLISHGYGVSATSGVRTELRTPVFEPSTATDTDLDGLADDIEFAIGTDITKGDTNGNGLDDFTEIQLGLNPLDGTAFPTGVVSTLGISGGARDVALSTSADGGVAQLAFVAAGAGGLAVVDASRFNKPVLLAQLALAGDAQDVVHDAQAKIAVVAAGAGGIHIVDVSNPSSPTLVRTINAVSTQVELLDGVIFTAVGSELRSYDVVTGERLASIAPSGSAYTSITRAGQYLYTVDVDRVVRAIEINGAALTARGQLNSGVRGKLFIGGSVLYIASEGYTAGGFATVDVANPSNLKLLSGVDNANLGGRAVAANGSGLAVLVGQPQGGNFGNVLDLADIRDPANTGLGAGSRIALPAFPYAVVISGGMAFVADGTAGLVVVNYLAFDNLGIAPTASLDTSGLDLDAGTPGIQVAEASVVSPGSSFNDDVQVRQVDLIVNGKTLRTDASYPFDLSFALPTIAANGGAGVKVQVRATDSGGNSTLSQVVELALVPDTKSPAITWIDPPNNSSRGKHFRSVTIVFDEAIDPSTVSAASIGLTGPAGAVEIEAVQARAGGTNIQITFAALTVGDHELVIRSSLIKDRAGNVLGAADLVSRFIVREATAVWTNPAGGYWDVSSNWDTGKVPGAGDDVLIDIPGNATITYRQATTEIRSLVSKNPFTITGGTLSVTQTVRVDNSFSLAGGTLKDATIVAGAPGSAVWGDNGTLSGVTLDTNLVIRNGRSIYVANGLKLNGNLTAEVGSSSCAVYFMTSQTVTGSGRIAVPLRSGANYLYTYYSGLAVVIDVPVDSMGPLYAWGNPGTMTFQRPVSVFATSFQSSGPTVVIESTFTAVHSTVRFATAFLNTGQMNLTNTALTLATQFTLEQLGAVVRTASDVFLTGKLDNSSRVLKLDADIGTWVVTGTVLGGTVTSEAPFSLRSGWNLSLESATLATTVTIPSGTTLAMKGSWSNLGVVRPAGGTLSLENSFTLEKLGALQYQSGVVKVKGTLDLAGQTLVMDSLSGAWQLDGGSLRGGVLGASSLPLEVLSGTLDSMSLQRQLVVPSGRSLVVVGGLTLDAELLVQGGGSAAYVYFTGQTVLGTGSIRLGGSAAFMYFGYNGSGDRTLVLSAEIELSGAGTVDAYYGGSQVLAMGRIAADIAGQQLTFTTDGTLAAADLLVSSGAGLQAAMAGQVGSIQLGQGAQMSFTAGTYELVQPVTVENGARLSLGGRWMNRAGITLRSGELVLAGEFTKPDLGVVDHLGGQITFKGVLLNNAASAEIDTLMSGWVVSGGTVRGGYVFASSGLPFVLPTAWNLVLDGATLLSPVTVGSGTALTFSGTWVMLAETKLAGGTVTLGGSFTPASIQLLTGVGSVRLSGNLALGGGTFDLTDRPDQWFLAGGTIESGSLVGGPSARLTVETSGTLRAMSLGVATTVPRSTTAYINDGLVLNTRWSIVGVVYCTGQTIDGDGSIVLGDTQYTGYLYAGYNSSGNRNLTIGSGIELSGRGSLSNYYSCTVAIGGEIVLDGTDSLSISCSALLLQGSVEVRGGADLYLSGLAGSLKSVRVEGVSSTLSASGAGLSVTDGVEVTAGGVASIVGLSGSAGTLSIQGASSRLTLSGSNYLIDRTASLSTGAALELRGSWTNTAQCSAAAGAQLLLGYSNSDVWTNVGQILAPGASITLRGAIGLANLGAVDFTGATVSAAFVLNLSGGTLTTGGMMGAWTLDGGTIVNGTVRGAPGGVFAIKSGTLDNVVLAIETRSENSVFLLNTLTLSDSVFRAVSGSVYFYSTGLNQLMGSGELVLGSASASVSAYAYQAGSTLRIGAGVTVRGSGEIRGVSSSGSFALELQGLVRADAAGRTLSLRYFTAFENDGQLVAESGGRLTVASIAGSLGTVYVDGAGSSLTATGVGYSNDGQINVAGGGSVTLNDRSGPLGAVVISGASSLSASGTGYVVNVPLVTSGGSITLLGAWTNASTIDVTSGTLQLGETGKNWQNNGQIRAAGSATTLNGVFRWADLGAFSRTGGTVTLKGVIDNRDTSITLQPTIGEWAVAGGKVWGGSVMGTNFGYTLPQGWDLVLDTVTLIRPIQVSDLTTLTMAGSWDNNSTLNLNGGTLNLGGTFNRGNLGLFSRAGGQVRLSGTLLNSSSTLTLDAALGSWVLAGGTIEGGTFAAAPGYELNVESGALSGVRLESDLTVPVGASLHIWNRLELAADVRLFGPTGGGWLYVHGFTDIVGQGVIVVGDAVAAGTIVFGAAEEGPTRIGANVTIRGRGTLYDNYAARLTLDGALIADVPASQLSVTIDGGMRVASGRLGILGASKLSIVGLQGDLGEIDQIPEGAAVTLHGAFTLNSDLAVPPTSSLTLGGGFVNTAALSATGATLTLGSGSIPWRNEGQVSVVDSILSLGGVVSPGSLGAIARTNSMVRMTGTMSADAPSNSYSWVTGVSSDWVGIAWGAGTAGAAGYVIERSNNSSSGFVEIARVAAADQEFFDRSIAPATSYYYRIRSYNEYGVSSSYYSVSATSKTVAASGLLMTVSQNGDGSGTRYSMIAPDVNFGWGTNSGPGAGGSDDWSAVLSGAIIVPQDGLYTLYTTSDDGVRVYVDDVLVIDNYTFHGETENSGSVFLTSSQRHRIRIEYFEGWGNAALRLSWSSASIAKAIVPAANLVVPLASELAEPNPGPVLPPGETELPVGTDWLLAGGTLSSVVLVVAPGQALSMPSGTLNNVSLEGDASITPGGLVYVNGNLTLDGTLSIDAGNTLTRLYFNSSTNQAMGGTGAVVLNGTADYARIAWYDTTRTITIGSGITISGAGRLGESNSNYVTLANDGVIASSSDSLWITPGYLLNRSTIKADPGTWLSVGGTLTNTGSILGDVGSTVNLAGRFTVDTLGAVAVPDGVVQFSGILDNTGRTLLANVTLAQWFLAGGRVLEGVVTTSNGQAYPVPADQSLGIEDADLLVDVIVSGSTLTLIDAWTTTRLVYVGDGGMLMHGGVVGLGAFAPVRRSGTGAVAISGTLDGVNGELALSDSTTGDLKLATGTIRRTRLTTADGRSLSAAGGTLDAVDLGVNVEVLPGPALRVITSLAGAGSFVLRGGTLQLAVQVAPGFLTSRITAPGGGKLIYQSTLELAGGLIDLDSLAYDVEFIGASVRNGIIRSQADKALRVAGGTTLRAMTLDANVEVSDGSYIYAETSLVLERRFRLLGSADLYFSGAGGVSGHGNIEMGWIDGVTWGSSTLSVPSGDFVFGPDMEILGGGYLSGAGASTTVTVQGSLTVPADAYFYVYSMATLRNQGILNIEPGAYLYGSGVTLLQDGHMIVDAGGWVSMSAGVVLGSGAVTEVFLDGDPEAQTPIQTTAMTFGGVLRVGFVGEYAPVPGDRITLFTYTSRTAVFMTVDVIDPPPGLAFAVEYADTKADLVVSLRRIGDSGSGEADAWTAEDGIAPAAGIVKPFGGG